MQPQRPEVSTIMTTGVHQRANCFGPHHLRVLLLLQLFHKSQTAPDLAFADHVQHRVARATASMVQHSAAKALNTCCLTIRCLHHNNC
jgi:hypothetical protein